MSFRLFLDRDVVEALHKLPTSRRRKIFEHLRKLQDFPVNYCDDLEQDEEGRRIQVTFFDRLAIHYWIDTADGHVKIMRLLKNE